MKIYCKIGKSAEALEILEIMKEEDIHPNEITYLDTDIERRGGEGKNAGWLYHFRKQH